MELSLSHYFLLFMIYSIAGWLMEVTCKLIEYKKFVNRGFLIGPYCPIYGAGALLITLLLSRFSSNWIILFITTIVLCGLLEYFTSYFMEKVFRARWWDYSKRKFNINGRVCLGTLIPFGIFGLIIMYVTNPLIIKFFNILNIRAINITSGIVFSIFLIDYILSYTVISGFRKTTVQVSKSEIQDNTEQITSKVKEILLQQSWGYKRLINAYPKLEAIRIRIKEISNEVKENAVDIKNNITEKAEEVKNNINEKKEEMKNSISEKKEEMKTNITQKGRQLSNSISHRKRIFKVKYDLGKRRLKKTFWTIKEEKLNNNEQNKT